jgi:hypothetical protein
MNLWWSEVGVRDDSDNTKFQDLQQSRVIHSQTPVYFHSSASSGDIVTSRLMTQRMSTDHHLTVNVYLSTSTRYSCQCESGTTGAGTSTGRTCPKLIKIQLFSTVHRTRTCISLTERCTTRMTNLIPEPGAVIWLPFSIAFGTSTILRTIVT